MEPVLDAIERLREQRPVFYSEADFQHALAWEMHLAEPSAQVRLEAPLLAGGRERLDLWFADRSQRLAIELKYPRAPFRAEIEGEPTPFERRSQDAEDDTRYAIAQDLRRIERLIEEGHADAGCVLVLTNIRSMWRVPPRPTTALDAAFRIHEDRVLSGQLEWGAGGRAKQPVPLTGHYVCRWRDYSELSEASGASVFRYSLLVTESSADD